MKNHRCQASAAEISFGRRTSTLQAFLNLRLLLFAALTGFCALTAQASDPIGIYALVDKVVLEPNDSAPERIQIWGAFALAEGRGQQYAPAKRGYLYFKVSPEKRDVCLKEWSDLKSLAGTKQVVGFAARHAPKGTIRDAAEKPARPEAYPLGFGLIKMRDKDYPPVKDLLGLSESKEPKKKETPERPT